MGQWDLPTDRPATFDEEGWRLKLHPAEFKGLWLKRRTIVQSVLLFIFLILPWVRINGQQALLLDVGRRHFEIFGLSLRAHNAPLLLFVLAVAGFGLFFVTAIWGRVWCGWACPQTVFIESVYRRIERWIEGSAGERRLLDAAAWTAKKIGLRLSKWSAFFIASMIITHSFLAYFVGTERLAEMVQRSPSENWTNFLFIAFSTGIIMFDFGWFREQFCAIACPYGRFQSVLMDSRSMIVGYDELRGEPRRGKAEEGKAQGDCVSCYRCVQVCPTGIDIRRGVQMECIACTACMDACDEIMTKTKKAPGLIRYATLRELRAPIGERTGLTPRFRINIRTGAYSAIIVLSAVLLVYFLATTKSLDIQVLRGIGSPYQELTIGAEKAILNQFFVEATNTESQDIDVDVQLTAPAGAELMTSQKKFHIRAGHTERIGFFIRFDPSLLKAEGPKLMAKLEFRRGDILITREVSLVGPLGH